MGDLVTELSLTIDKLNLARAKVDKLQSDLDQTWIHLERAYANMCYTQTMLRMTNAEMKAVADGRDCRNLKHVSEKVKANSAELAAIANDSFGGFAEAGACKTQREADVKRRHMLMEFDKRMNRLFQEECTFRCSWAEMLQTMHQDANQSAKVHGIVIGGGQNIRPRCNYVKDRGTYGGVEVRVKSVEERQLEIDNTKLKWDTLEMELQEKERNLDEMQMETNVQETSIDNRQRKLNEWREAFKTNREEISSIQLNPKDRQWEEDSKQEESETEEIQAADSQLKYGIPAGKQESLSSKCSTQEQQELLDSKSTDSKQEQQEALEIQAACSESMADMPGKKQESLEIKHSEVFNEQYALDAEQEELDDEMRRLRELQRDLTQLRSEILAEQAELIEGRIELRAMQRELDEEKVKEK